MYVLVSPNMLGPIAKSSQSSFFIPTKLIFFKIFASRLEIKYKNDFNFDYRSFFNLIGLITIIIGFFFLYKRKSEKKIKDKNLKKKIYQLKDKIKNGNEFIL